MTFSAADNRSASVPRLVFFHVSGRRDLAQRAAAAAPGVRFAPRRSWNHDPGEQRRPLLGGEPSAGLWFWKGTADEFAAQAERVLLHLVHPLIGRGAPFCFGFPFGPEVLAPLSLGVDEAARLDLEDIGRLLGAAAGDRAAAGSGATAGLGPGAEHGRAAALVAAPRQASIQSPSAPASRRRAAGGPDAVQLDAAQRAAVEHHRGAARVLAPAGSGKTKTLVSRVVELVDRGADPSGILMLAFNRKAAEQLEERLATLGITTTRRLGTPPDARPGRRRRPGRSTAADRPVELGAPERPPGVHCATFNAFGYRYQREALQARVSLDHDGRSLRALMTRAMQTAGVSLRELRPRRGSDPVGAFMSALTRVRASLEPVGQVEVRVECVTDTPIVTVPFASTHAQYTRAQAATGLQSFDDQIYFAVADMLADPAHRTFIQRRFEHVLVDEFQDLNGAQLALVDVLSRPHRELFVVGDDDQLIYGWRQADARGILEFHRRMPPKPWSATYTLRTNYRCSRAVVETGARLVANNVVREAKEIRPRAGAQDGAVRFAGAPAWPERAQTICAFLRAEKARLSCGWRDLAVLCRYRSQQLLVALALDAGGIPRTPALGCRLFTHPSARLLRAYLDLVRTPGELPAAELAGLLNRPNRYVRDGVVEAVGAASEPWARVRAVAAAEPAAGPRPLSTLVELVEQVGTELAAVLGADPAAASLGTAEDLVWTVVEAFGLDDHWAAEADAAAGGRVPEASSAGAAGACPFSPPGSSGADAGPDGVGSLQVFDSLLLLAETYPDPAVYLRTWDRLLADEVAHEGVSDDTVAREESEEDRVVVGTVHAAKGREYDAVVIPDYDCDTSRWEPLAVEEERRVVYVGVTRARDTALFTVDTSGGFVHPFLRELVEAPEHGEHDVLSAWLEQETDEELSARIADRLNEIEVLFPELVPTPADLEPSAPAIPP